MGFAKSECNTRIDDNTINSECYMDDKSDDDDDDDDDDDVFIYFFSLVADSSAK